MPRRPRQYLPGLSYHVRQRGNNRQACFFEINDRQVYVDLLQTVLKRYGVSLHAYVLMTNHVHLLMTPATIDGISRAMQVLASRYAYHINKTHGRTGSLWEGRHKSSAVESDRYLLACYRYIEMNPVAANLVRRPEHYPWSSYAANALLHENQLITPHVSYLALGKDATARCAHYRRLFDERLSTAEVENIQMAMHYCLPLGGKAFCAEVEQQLGRKLGQRGRGRPKKTVKK
ncbi:MAG: transposase [Pseudomonadota bacterium]